MAFDKRHLLKSAYNYTQAGQWDRALDEYRRTAHLFPDDPNIHSMISDLLAKRGDSAGAARSQMEAARLFRAQGADDKELACLRKALRIQAGLADARSALQSNIGRTLVVAHKALIDGDFDGAATLARRMQDADPGSMDANRLLDDIAAARLAAQSRQAQDEEAKAAPAGEVQDAAADVLARLEGAVQAYLSAEDYDNALETLLVMLKLDPGRVSVQAQLAETQAKMMAVQAAQAKWQDLQAQKAAPVEAARAVVLDVDLAAWRDEEEAVRERLEAEQRAAEDAARRELAIIETAVRELRAAQASLASAAPQQAAAAAQAGPAAEPPPAAPASEAIAAPGAAPAAEAPTLSPATAAYHPQAKAPALPETPADQGRPLSAPAPAPALGPAPAPALGPAPAPALGPAPAPAPAFGAASAPPVEVRGTTLESFSLEAWKGADLGTVQVPQRGVPEGPGDAGPALHAPRPEDDPRLAALLAEREEVLRRLAEEQELTARQAKAAEEARAHEAEVLRRAEEMERREAEAQSKAQALHDLEARLRSEQEAQRKELEEQRLRMHMKEEALQSQMKELMRAEMERLHAEVRESTLRELNERLEAERRDRQALETEAGRRQREAAAAARASLDRAQSERAQAEEAARKEREAVELLKAQEESRRRAFLDEAVRRRMARQSGGGEARAAVMKNSRRISDVLHAATTRHLDEDIDAMLATARRYLRQDLLVDAMRLCQKIALKEPDNEKVKELLKEIYQRKGL